MATLNNTLFTHNIKSFPSTIKRPTNNTIFFFPSPSNSKNFPKPRVALPVSSPQTLNAEYLEAEFSGHGVSFTQISDSCVVRMMLKNGSVANVLLPCGLITSYKAEMWHGGVVEILHTSVSQGDGDDENAVVRGGVSVAVNLENDRGVSWSPTTWGFHRVEGGPRDEIQVELISKNTEGDIEIKNIITLKQDCLKSEIRILNHSTSPLRMWGSVLGHLTVSTPEATYAIGLENSDFVSHPPLLTEFGIIPPGFGARKSQAPNKLWGFLSGSRVRSQGYNGGEDETEGEETDNNKCLNDEMSKIYRHTPRGFTILDRGMRNSVIIGREGFKEVYIMSPGSSHEWYGKHAYVCIGQSALLEPIVVKSQDEWRGVHSFHNPNL